MEAEVQRQQIAEGVVCCPACGTINELASERLNVLEGDVINAERELRTKRARIKALQADQAELRKHDPNYPAAKEVLAYWHNTCAPSARDPYCDKRLTAVLTRLKKYSAEDLKRAAKGYSLKPYVTDQGRQATGSHEDWRADAELIYRDAPHVDAGIRFLASHEAQQAALTPREEEWKATGQVEAQGDRIARYASALGFSVFPCKPNAKEPATRHGFQDATKDVERIKRCWNTRPDLNVAVATGAVSGIVVLDVDDYKGGGESLHELEARYGVLPTTLSATTPRGGQHYFFKHPGRNVANAVDLVPGVDVRGDGGYVLIAPSVVGDRGYEWDERSCVAPLPDWLARGLTRKLEQIGPATDWAKFVQEGATQGARNHRMTQYVGHLFSHGHSAGEVFELAKLVNQRVKPPLPDREIEASVKSIARREARKT